MKEPHIIDWILDSTEQNKRYYATRHTTTNWKKEFYIFVCPKCKDAYEEIKVCSSSKEKHVLKYKDFPKYKLPVKVCLNCNAQMGADGSKDIINRQIIRK